MPDTIPNLDVPTIPSASSTPIVTEVNLPAPKVLPVDVAKELGIDAGIRGPADIFGADEAPDKVNERIESGLKVRDEHGRFVAKSEIQKPPAKPKTTPAVAAKPAVPAKPVIPAAPAKIKIGDQEKTAEEWQAYHKELAEKAEKAIAPAKPEAEKPAAEAPKEADETVARDAFITATAKQYTPTQEEFDKMLESGDATVFGKFIANAVADMRKWVTDEVGPRLGDVRDRIEPISRSYEQAEQYQTEARFLDANPEIKAITTADPTKLEVHRALNAELSQEFDAMKSLAAQNPDNAWAKRRMDEIGKDFLGELAKLTKANLGINGVAPAAVAVPEPAKPVTKVPPAERPLSSDRPGAASAPRTETQEQRLSRELNEHQGVSVN